jgi:phage terminase Nu1 subunit (DNA packaging protein)
VELTTQQVADRLGVSYRTVINYTERQDDPLPVQVARRGLKEDRRFDSAVVAAWAARHGIPYDDGK